MFARERLKLFGLVALGIAVLYAPWLPTLLSQARHTGAPWSTVPTIHDLVLAPMYVLGSEGAFIALALVGGAGLAEVVRRHVGEERRIVLALATLGGVTIVVGVHLVADLARLDRALLRGHPRPACSCSARAGSCARTGSASSRSSPSSSSGASTTFTTTRRTRARSPPASRPTCTRASSSISTHPEQGPVLRYYLGAGLSLGDHARAGRRPQVFDWRDAVTRLAHAKAKPTLDGLIATVPRGGTFVVITPVFRDYRAWRAKWTKLVWQKSTAWTWLLQRDPRVKLVAHVATVEIAVKKNYFKPLQAFVYRRVG